MKKVIVTGGGGFVGKALCEALAAKGYEVIALSRKKYPELEARGIRSEQADLSRIPFEGTQYFHGVDGVFHVAAKVDMWGRREDFVASNITATKNVLDAAQRAGVARFVFTSSPSVIADGSDLRGVDESYPYPAHYLAYYPQTKAAAERAVLAAHTSQFRTLSLRPHLIWGPGDNHFVPTIVERARAGRLLRVGSGKNNVDLCYIDDCVNAHIQAFETLAAKADIGGKAYFVTQGEPVLLWSWIDEVLRYHGIPPLRKSIPERLASMLAFACEGASRLIPGFREPLLTRFLVSEMAHDHYFSIDAARRAFGYRPSCSIKEALEKTFSQMSNGSAGATRPELETRL